MVLPQVISRNQAQTIPKFSIGSRLTVWGTSVTEAIIGTEAISTYRVPSGKRAIIRGILLIEDGTSHVFGSLRKFSGASSLSTTVAIVFVPSANTGAQVSFENEFDNTGDFFSFTADATPNDMVGSCLATVEELPA